MLSGTGDPAASPVVTLTPTTLGFGSVTVRAQSAVQTVTVRNTGTAPLNVSAVTRTGAAAADYVVTTATATRASGAVVPGRQLHHPGAVLAHGDRPAVGGADAHPQPGRREPGHLVRRCR